MRVDQRETSVNYEQKRQVQKLQNLGIKCGHFAGGKNAGHVKKELCWSKRDVHQTGIANTTNHANKS